MPGVFVTGTGTGVGKTVVAAAIVATLRARGADAVPMKPVQTGSAAGGCDLSFCLKTAGLHPDSAEQDLMCPYIFKSPCSPHLAAAREGMAISVERILDCSRQLQKRHEIVVVEGAGGLMVPLNDDHYMLDLMQQLGFPVVVVARPGLGTLNHTLLTLQELKRSGLRVEAVLLNDETYHPWGAVEKDNLDTLRKRCHASLVTRFPHYPSAEKGPLSQSDLSLAHPVLQPLLDRLQPTTS